jgi:hypothetical protein
MTPIFGILGISLNPLTYIAKAIGGALSSALKDLGSFLSNNTMVTIGSRYHALIVLDAEITALVGVLVLLMAAARVALTGNIAQLARDVIRVMVAVALGFFLLLTVPIAEGVVHELSNLVAGTFSSSSAQLAGTLSTSTGALATATLLSGGSAALIPMIMAVIMIVGILAIYLALVVAQVMAYVAIYFLPLTLVFSPKLGRKVGELLGVCLVTPFLVTSLLAIGIAVLGDAGNTGTILEHMLGGVGLIVVTAFSPMFAHKLLQGGSAAITNARAPHAAIHQTASAAHAGIQHGSASASAGGSMGASAGGAAAKAAGPAAAVVAAAGAVVGHAKASSHALQGGTGKEPGSTAAPAATPAGQPTTPAGQNVSFPDTPAGTTTPPVPASTPPSPTTQSPQQDRRQSGQR